MAKIKRLKINNKDVFVTFKYEETTWHSFSERSVEISEVMAKCIVEGKKKTYKLAFRSYGGMKGTPLNLEEDCYDFDKLCDALDIVDSAHLAPIINAAKKVFKKKSEEGLYGD